MKIKQFPDAESTALALAREAFILPSHQGLTHIALSGGNTPKLLFELLATKLSNQVNWENIRLYWVDERCVSPEDEQSNYRMTRLTLLDKLSLENNQIHRIHGESIPKVEAERYTRLVFDTLPTVQGLPQFDIILLGIGDDGHTSSIFPHQMELLRELTPYVVAESPKGQKRIALTGPSILNGRRVIFHSVGSSKRSIQEAIVKGSPEAESFPAYHLIKQREDIELYTDQDL